MSINAPVASKRCTKCKEEKPLDDFVRDSSRKDGRSYRCKSCIKKPQRQSAIKWAAKNLDYYRRKGKEYYDKDPEKFRERKLVQYHKDKNKLVFVLSRKLKCAKERSQKRGYECEISLDDLLSLYERQEGKCAVSGRQLEVGGRSESANEKQNGLSLDRIDCSRGYVIDNIRLVVWGVNVAMRKWGTKAFQGLCLDVVRHNRMETGHAG